MSNRWGQTDAPPLGHGVDVPYRGREGKPGYADRGEFPRRSRGWSNNLLSGGAQRLIEHMSDQYRTIRVQLAYQLPAVDTPVGGAVTLAIAHILDGAILTETVVCPPHGVAFTAPAATCTVDAANGTNFTASVNAQVASGIPNESLLSQTVQVAASGLPIVFPVPAFARRVVVYPYNQDVAATYGPLLVQQSCIAGTDTAVALGGEGPVFELVNSGLVAALVRLDWTQYH